MRVDACIQPQNFLSFENVCLNPSNVCMKLKATRRILNFTIRILKSMPF